ncbi:TetR/AcrR family transcriptional regulator [Spongiactinospora sp. TRM90649]|uniref:TetR/AcrR family transcriptional regulator n=1 Tax=Spongiactinospora sp. TRM90649 TaxID=3031114 RepID=UPI0023F66F6D|nr:TetR/AcrR family transcriptional regulator [Spongiactinospora sp. TRM90649]MDF5755597.1 TetR/AcrR family transcriptional regulator [Spongiactinospora sp. TRM90649]
MVEAARELVTGQGPAALTMRALADRLGIRAPSLYKHFPDKGAVEARLIEAALEELAAVLEAAVRSAPQAALAALTRAYRAYALREPHLYRLMSNGPLPRDLLRPGVEDAAAEQHPAGQPVERADDIGDLYWLTGDILICRQ